MTTKKSELLRCNYFDKNICRSCGLLDIPYHQQVTRKQTHIAATFSTQLRSTPVILPFEPADYTFGSRTKSKMAVAGTSRDPIIGITDRLASTRELLECPLHHTPINQLIAFIRSKIIQHQLEPYDIQKRTGELKFLLFKVAEDVRQQGEILVRFVCKTKAPIPQLKQIAEELTRAFPQVVLVSVNLQPEPKAVIEGLDEIVLSPRDYITEKLGEITLCYGPQSFSQVTSHQALKLYQFAADTIAQWKPRKMIDLYCGVGAFSMFAAANYSSLEEVLGIEVSELAIINAQRGAKINQLSCCSFITADAELFLQSYSTATDVVVVNPPRRGLSPAIIERICSLQPRAVFYSSCNPLTLKRDLLLFEKSYRCVSLKGFDLFPLTEHMEIAASLEKRTP